MALVVDRLVKRFGPVVALDGMDFRVEPGQIFGFLGANGAGKTTTMRIVLDILRAGRGDDRPGTGRRPPSCRAGRGATCPRSAASTRG